MQTEQMQGPIDDQLAWLVSRGVKAWQATPEGVFQSKLRYPLSTIEFPVSTFTAPYHGDALMTLAVTKSTMDVVMPHFSTIYTGVQTINLFDRGLPVTGQLSTMPEVRRHDSTARIFATYEIYDTAQKSTMAAWGDSPWGFKVVHPTLSTLIIGGRDALGTASNTLYFWPQE